MTDPLVSVLLLTFNRPAALARCLDCISRQRQQNFEVVLVEVSTLPKCIQPCLGESLWGSSGAPSSATCQLGYGRQPLVSAIPSDGAPAGLHRRQLRQPPDRQANLLEVVGRHTGALVGGAVQNGQPRSLIAIAAAGMGNGQHGGCAAESVL